MNIDHQRQLSVLSAKKILDNAITIANKIKEGKNVYTFFDTETTGTEPYGDKNDNMKRDRLLEIGAVSYTLDEKGIQPLKNKDNEIVIYHDYINPFIEPENQLFIYNSKKEMGDSYIVHGITKDFLNGKGDLGGFKLKTAARPFTETRDYFELFMNTDNALKFLLENNYINGSFEDFTGEHIFVAHNASFDKKVLNAEFEKDDRFNKDIRYQSDFEGHVKVLDTLALSREIIPKKLLEEKGVDYSEVDNFGRNKKPGYTLDYLQFYYDIEADRDLHGALVDSKILADIYNCLINDDGYINAPNSPIVKSEQSITDFFKNKIEQTKIVKKDKNKALISL